MVAHGSVCARFKFGTTNKIEVLIYVAYNFLNFGRYQMLLERFLLKVLLLLKLPPITDENQN